MPQGKLLKGHITSDGVVSERFHSDVVESISKQSIGAILRPGDSIKRMLMISWETGDGVHTSS